jgi:hypothetical protein
MNQTPTTATAKVSSMKPILWAVLFLDWSERLASIRALIAATSNDGTEDFS